MTASRDGASEGRPLENLGISEPEERVYRWLLAHSRARASDVARALTLGPTKVQRLLDAVEAKGLATHSPERPRRYIPAAPDVALEALVMQRQKGLRDVQRTIKELQKEATNAGNHKREQLVELITSREVERQVYEQMPLSARDEIVALVRGPMLISQLNLPPDQDNYAQIKAIARGVRCRSIVDLDYLQLPGAVQATQCDIEAGEAVRIVSRLPFKMAITDRRIALVPLNLHQPDGPSLLVRSSALLDALYALFEMLWERAVPLSFTEIGALELPEIAPTLPEESKELVFLMAAGMNDKSIASEMDISMRTLQRYTAELMQAMEVRTRFQLGWLAALRFSEADAEQAAKPSDDRNS
jgi:sugar-specific transcriptional regulator TrmB